MEHEKARVRVADNGRSLGRASLCIALAIAASGCVSTGQGSSNLRMPGFGTSSAAPQAAPWTPSIDTKGVKTAKYELDFAECKAFAEADPGTNGRAVGKKSAMKWGLGGAALVGVATVMTGGAAAAVLLPAMAAPAAMTAGTAAAAGGLSAKAGADAKYRNVVGTCLEGRGYRVLN